jgi:hypothetical protein
VIGEPSVAVVEKVRKMIRKCAKCGGIYSRQKVTME